MTRTISQIHANRVSMKTTFSGDALNMLNRFKGQFMTGENLRAELTSMGITPDHGGAWGALVRTALKSRDLLPTDMYVQSKLKSNNGRRARVYLVN